MGKLINFPERRSIKTEKKPQPKLNQPNQTVKITEDGELTKPIKLSPEDQKRLEDLVEGLFQGYTKDELDQIHKELGVEDDTDQG